jgi:uncharacterized protein (DUF2126 family)
MAIHVALHHRTHYRYDRPINLGPQVVRLRPAPHCRTRILGYSLKIQPEEHFINWQQDPQSNYLARLTFPEKTRELCVEVDLVAEMAVYNPFDFFLEPSAEKCPFIYDPALDHELEPYRRKIGETTRFHDYLESVRRELLPDGRPIATIDFLVGLNQRIWKDISYTIRMEPGVQTPEVTLKSRTGSCRDFAWLLCQLMRHLGLAARFVSGYLIQLAPDQKSLDGPSGPEKDFTDLHAWCEVYLPGAGWIGLDATSGLLAGEGHIPLAATPDPSSAAPITGVLEPAETEFSFEMSVTRIFETPRVTKPYSEEQWSAIDTLGQQVDAELKAGDVRLTMGGEPTFVSIDDPDGAEWNTAAMGPKKRGLSDVLMRKLKAKYAPNGFLHYGQGKWYPGESLPRWAFACYWRKDGEPIWEDPELLAKEGVDYGTTADDAKAFINHLATLLEVDPKWTMPAYEDPYYYIWKERRLPSNVDPLASKLTDPEERKRLAEVFERGLPSVVGYCMPLARCADYDGNEFWQSGPWFLRPERMFLLPGDSPMGFRLPLDSLPWVSKEEFPYLTEEDPSIPRVELPPTKDIRQRYRLAPRDVRPVRRSRTARRGQILAPRATLPNDEKPGDGQSAPWIVRTAMCIQPRNGRLHVFMPPLHLLEEYLDLLAAIEATAAHLGLPVLIEGYSPPRDPRLNEIKVTPDPGVIEVNTQPVESWEELVASTRFLYESARETRLGTEKFMVDGRHTGTGGGNHVVVGGPTPTDSPFLRRPDLLRSLLTYWQHHPSLSYVFSGLFIGPTSQSPRIDEARHDALRELELAFRQIRNFESVPPWLTDRLFRNLLTDVSGNTHRAEFCIDKLYSPDSSAGRLGLLELRGFEMPPHAEMSLFQQLLLRALIARFWKTPYTADLIRWGTHLHDKWMMPHHVWNDLEEITAEMREAGYAFDPAWFAPHWEFRFPLYGEVELGGLLLEIRQALEPWHVLGEEGAAGGTVRFVDSSVERLEVKVSGGTQGRFVVTCNGIALPLQRTGRGDEMVAAVRYRAWQPPSCLHPTIGVHSPLVIEVVDAWNKRSLGGCTYHVMHPGGRNYETFPINAYEAESRRLARFQRSGLTGGEVAPAPAQIDPEFPWTLDLRKFS